MGDAEREAVLLAALVALDRPTLKAALQATAVPRLPVPAAAANALGALRRHRDPGSVVTRPQYRAALPYAVAVVSEPCLQAVIEALGDASDDPTAEQLAAALDAVQDEFDDAVVSVMLASVAADDMPATPLCMALVDGTSGDGRYALEGWRDLVRGSAPPAVEGAPVGKETSEAQRAERKARRQREADERRHRADAAARAAEALRRGRGKKGVEQARTAPDSAGLGHGGPGGPIPTVETRRRPTLSPVQAAEFDGDDPLVGSIVLAWVPFGDDPDSLGIDGKERPCIVIAGSPTHLLVRACYSEGGRVSRRWTSTPIVEWRTAGLDKPTHASTEAIRVERPQSGATATAMGKVTATDWNALW